MTKSRRQMLILAASVVVMIAVYVRALRPSGPIAPKAGGRPPASESAAATARETAAAPASGVVSLDLPEALPARQAQRDQASRLAWGRDPFTGGAAGAEVSGFDLSGILWDATQPIAVINGQMLRVGDELESYKVTQIAQDSVLLSDGSQTLTLAIPQ